MEKFSKNRYSPRLFDLTQDITGALPLKLVEQWVNSDQTHDDALRLLRGHTIRGYSVSSDSRSLSENSQSTAKATDSTHLSRDFR